MQKKGKNFNVQVNEENLSNASGGSMDKVFGTKMNCPYCGKTFTGTLFWGAKDPQCCSSCRAKNNFWS